MGKIMKEGMEVIAVLVAFGLVGLTIGVDPYYSTLANATATGGSLENAPGTVITTLEVFPAILLAVVALTGVYKLTN